mgnify:CR=1 FL=1
MLFLFLIFVDTLSQNETDLYNQMQLICQELNRGERSRTVDKSYYDHELIKIEQKFQEEKKGGVMFVFYPHSDVQVLCHLFEYDRIE